MLFKRNRIPFPIPGDARKLTEEEMVQVNGGAEEKKVSQESKSESVTVQSGNTLSGIVSDYNKANGTNYTVSDVAKNSGSSSQGNNPASAQTGGNQGNYSVSNSTNANPGSSVSSSSSSSNTAPNADLKKNSLIDYKRDFELMNGWYENSTIGKLEKQNKERITGNNINGNKDEGKGAWEVKNEWTDAYIKKYREYTPEKIEEYRSKNMRFTCEDLGLSVLIDFASENNLPVTITNGSGKYSNSDPSFSSPEEFKVKVLSTTGAKDMLSNTVGIGVQRLQAGDLICMDTGIYGSKKDGEYSHIQMITGKIGTVLGIRQGNLVELPFRTADYGSSSYAGMIIAGRAYDYGRDIFYGSDRTYSNAHSIFGMSFRSWDFERM